MNKKILVITVCLCALGLSILNCAPGGIFGPTATPTATLTPTPTPTPTPLPGAVITGRIYLIDRGDPVMTRIYLMEGQGAALDEVEHTSTDADGHYSFTILEAGTYSLELSLMTLVNRCDNLRFELSDWLPFFSQLYDTTGISDVRITSIGITVDLGDEVTLDCGLYCD